MTEKGTNQLRDIAAYLDAPKHIRVGDKDYDLVQLTVADLAAARDHVVDRRIHRYLSTVRGAALNDNVLAKTMAEIECAPLLTYDVIDDAEGRLKLLHLSLTRAGGSMTLDRMRADLKPMVHRQLFAYLLWISGCQDSPAEGGDSESPLANSEAPTVSL
jgi:hypothetical protein